MSLFFHPSLTAHDSIIALEEDTAKHVVAVLRMQPGDALSLTNGKGFWVNAVIETAHKKSCTVSITDGMEILPLQKKIVVGAAFTRNNNRNEWMVEKLTELGVSAIIPLYSDHSVKVHYRTDRYQAIAISAMLQSRQAWLPQIDEATAFDDALGLYPECATRLLAHCEKEMERSGIATINKAENTLLFIGPEGDFSKEEIHRALAQNFVPVSLGTQRLRTETAAVAAASFLRLSE